ncbi:hypothetical protein ISCGN_010899 [Ixodes scapularis]
MHLHFERTCSSRTDCAVLSLTWMGKVPDELPEEDGWRLNRVNYYQDGWLASGNARGIVGVTFTTCHCRKTAEHPVRTNYNLRGHRSEVSRAAGRRARVLPLVQGRERRDMSLHHEWLGLYTADTSELGSHVGQSTQHRPSIVEQRTLGHGRTARSLYKRPGRQNYVRTRIKHFPRLFASY